MFDVTQLKTVNGILKSAIIFLTLVGGILSAAGNTVGPHYNVGSSDFTTFTCFTAMLQNVIYLVMYLFGTTPFFNPRVGHRWVVDSPSPDRWMYHGTLRQCVAGAWGDGVFQLGRRYYPVCGLLF